VLLWLLACNGQTPPEPAPKPTVAPQPITALEPAAVDRIQVSPGLPTRKASSPLQAPAADDVKATRQILAQVVRSHARDPNNPWAIGHAMLALGPEVVLDNDKPAVEWLFEEYAQRIEVDGKPAIRFPKKRGNIRIEPHSDLILKALTETGVPPDRQVTVQGQSMSVADLYRGSLARAWVDGTRVSYGAWNDTPWALQGLAAWSPQDAKWTAAGHEMTLDAFAHDVTQRLVRETAFMDDAMRADRQVQKRGQDIFSYTCGGAHLLQGSAYAVAKGFGEDSDKAVFARQGEIMAWRYDLELMTVDQALVQAPQYQVLLLEQRMKFLGHYLESMHKLAALGLIQPTDAYKQSTERALAELVVTVSALKDAGILDRLDEIKASSEQTYLDYVGDAAHAIRGIDLATGEGTVSF
jgi:hypothetical protein